MPFRASRTVVLVGSPEGEKIQDLLSKTNQLGVLTNPKANTLTLWEQPEEKSEELGPVAVVCMVLQ